MKLIAVTSNYRQKSYYFFNNCHYYLRPTDMFFKLVYETLWFYSYRYLIQSLHFSENSLFVNVPKVSSEPLLLSS